jgi:hypothetical protein
VKQKAGFPSPLIWVGRQKTAGRGEGGSNLVFDRIDELQRKQ